MLRVLSIFRSSGRSKTVATVTPKRRRTLARRVFGRLRLLSHVLPVTAALVFILGCSPATPRHGTTPLPTREELFGNQSGGVLTAQPATVASGKLPLRYIVSAPSYLTVVDVATRQTIATASAQAGTLVSIDSRSGIIIGGKQLRSQPLTSTRTYALEIQPLPAASRPQSTPAPSTQPTTGPAARSARQIMQRQQKPPPALAPPTK